jgi:hypothetical protein
VLGVEGEISRSQREALATLLNVDMRRRDLALSMETPGGDVREWIDRARSDEETLLVAVLDASRPGTWQLTIVDASRGRALTRALVGGVEANAAALEAVVSIVSSAAGALKDGLEVASRPLDEVVAPPESTSPPATAPLAAPAPAPRPAKLALRSVLAATAASFGNGAPLTEGLSAAIGLSYRSLGFRVFGARYWPARVDSSFGSFDVHRTTGGASVGATFSWGSLEVEPEGALVGELLRRTDAEPGLDASANGDRSLHRFGAALDARIRYRLGGPFAIEWMAGASYFAPKVRFLAANAQLSELIVPWAWVVSSQIGLEVRTP